MRDALGGAQAGLGIGVSADGYVTRTAAAAWSSRSRSARRYDAEFSRALDARLREIDASTPGTARTAGRRRRASRCRRCRCSSPAAIASRVETEAAVKRESILNTVGSLALDPAAALRRVSQPLARRPSARCRRCCRSSSSSAPSGSPAPGCRPRPRAPPRCSSASAWTASCCCTSRTGSRSTRIRRPMCPRRSPARRAACCSACGRRRRRSTG